jgi:ribA/ribD-fused uncharacterized protein
VSVIAELTGKYRPLSNFWSCFIMYNGTVYPSVENAYQAAKCKNRSDREKFLYIKSSEAKRLGRVVAMRDDWEEVKLDLMYRLVKQKFEKYSELRELLLETHSYEIQEGNWWGDTFWGTVNGKGQNHLGKILMRVRDGLNVLGEV